MTPREPGYAGAMASIRFRPSLAEVEVPVGTTLHAAVLQAGLPIASACGGDGLCARCGVEILEGGDAVSAETDAERDAKHRNRIDAALRLACRARVEGDLVVTAAYW